MGHLLRGPIHNRTTNVLLLRTDHLLLTWIGHLIDKVLRFQYLDLRSSEVGGFDWRANHAGILTALDEGDPKRAADAMRQDISNGRELVLQAALGLPEFRRLNLGGGELIVSHST